MLFTLKNNAYHILGLDTSVSDREILKRSKEIINHIKAGDLPSFDLDIGLFKDFRTEDSVKDALQRMQAPKKRIKEYFFWFQIADNIDEQVLGLFQLKDYLDAIRTWQKAAEGKTIKALFYKKNLAILYCLVLYTQNSKEYLQASLSLWKELLDSDKFWSAFSKVYKLHDEQTASEDTILEFKKHVVEYLSDIYTELHHIHKNSDYISIFQEVFSTKGEKIEKNILGPAYQAIGQAVEELEKMEVSKDSIFDKEESEKIKHLISKIQNELNNLMDLGLFDDSQTKIMRDRAAVALRSIALDLHNNLSELDKSLGLHGIAIELAGTESLKNKLKDEQEQIQKNIKDDSDNSLEVTIPRTFGNATIIFKNAFVDYNNKRIFYRDVTSISFDSTATTSKVYGIPVSTSYAYRISIVSEKEIISLSLSAHREESEEKDCWVKLVGLTSSLIEPLIIKRLVDQIFNRGEVVKIGDIEFSKQGYSKMKFRFFKEKEKLMVYWTDTIYIPKFHQGHVVLWEDNQGKNSLFASIPMSTPNAVTLPNLVQACCDNRE